MQIVKTTTFTWPVRHLVAADGGGAEVVALSVTFRRLKSTEVQALDADIRDKKLNDPQVIERVATGWDLRQVDGAPVSWDQREQAFEAVPGLAGSMVRAFFASFDPQESAKN